MFVHKEFIFCSGTVLGCQGLCANNVLGKCFREKLVREKGKQNRAGEEGKQGSNFKSRSSLSLIKLPRKGTGFFKPTYHTSVTGYRPSKRGWRT